MRGWLADILIANDQLTTIPGVNVIHAMLAEWHR